MPESIIVFERLAYLSVILGLASAGLNWPATEAVYNDHLWISLSSLVATFGLEILFIWLAARKRKNWARWIWIVLVFGGTAAAVVMRGAHLDTSLIPAIAYYLTYLVSLASACFLLTPASSAWFRNDPNPRG